MAKKVDILFAGIRVAKATKYDYTIANDITETETFDGTELADDDSPKYSGSFSRVETIPNYEKTLEEIKKKYPDGFPIIIRDGDFIARFDRCFRANKKVTRDTKSKRMQDIEFRAQGLTEN